jgi:hypothetical protein
VGPVWGLHLKSVGRQHMRTSLRLPTLQKVFLAFTFLVTVATVLLFWFGKPELVPQLWVSAVVALLSYLACVFSAEKLRLDLFDRRLEIYRKTLEYCSTVLAYASLVFCGGHLNLSANMIQRADGTHDT